MFSEQYKKENEHLKLDEDFLERLKLNMRKEKERLDAIETPIPNQPSILMNDNCASDTHDSHKTRSRNRMNHLLPLTLSAGAALLLITLVPSVFTKKEDKCSYDVEMNSTDATESVEKCEESQTESFQEFEAGTSGTCDSTPAEVESAKEQFSEAPTSESAESATVTEEDMFSCDSITNTTLAQTPKDSEFPIFDGIVNHQLIFHTSSELFFYDIEAQQLINTENLTEQIGSYALKGEHILKMQITEDETALILSNLDNNNSYRYDLDTHEFKFITESDLQDITYLNTDDKLMTNTEMFDGLIDPKNRSLTAWNLGDNTYDILYYQCIEDETIASLSICQVSLSEDGSVLEKTILPIFGEDTITELQNKGYELSGNH